MVYSGTSAQRSAGLDLCPIIYAWEISPFLVINSKALLCRSWLFPLVWTRSSFWNPGSPWGESRWVGSSCTILGISSWVAWDSWRVDFCVRGCTCLGSGWFSDGATFSWGLRGWLPNRSTRCPTPGCSGRSWPSTSVILPLWGPLRTRSLRGGRVTGDVEHDAVEADCLGPVGCEFREDGLRGAFLLGVCVLFLLVFSIHYLDITIKHRHKHPTAIDIWPIKGLLCLYYDIGVLWGDKVKGYEVMMSIRVWDNKV
jgi:hypothetical protein